MPDEEQSSKVTQLPKWAAMLLDVPWVEILGELWKVGKKVMRGMANEGVYEVLDYETTLELHDSKGRKATLKKCQKVRYLQNHIIAYQDQAWGDGKILVNYRCSPGFPVDRYRSGYKTLVLISLRKVKNKGDIDEFNIQWGIRNGFLKRTGFWASEINHRTKRIKVNLTFPKIRPPQRIFIQEKNSQRSYELNNSPSIRLPDGRWLVEWEKIQPRLYEQYILNWEW
jgi:hypothetical protein